MHAGVIQKEFVFDNSTKEYPNVKDHLKYLGQLTSSTGEIFNIVLWSTIWGRNNHTINFIYVYDEKRRYKGKYKYLLREELPLRIEKNKLVYYSITPNGDVDKKHFYKIGFEKGIPLNICISCNEDDDRGVAFSIEH
jgi:hypothetical protein